MAAVDPPMRLKHKCPKCGTNMHFIGHTLHGKGHGGISGNLLLHFKWRGCRQCGYREWEYIPDNDETEADYE